MAPVAGPSFFASAAQFRDWLKLHHAVRTELLVGFWKVDSGRPSMTWPESVDQALCFGWIDGVRKRIDAHSYSIRFTPRRAGSIWSHVNITKMAQLTRQRLVRAAGRRAFEARREDKSRVYAFEQGDIAFPPAMKQAFCHNPTAWNYWLTQPPSYRKVATWWVIQAKRATTREARMAQLIAVSQHGRRLDVVTLKPKSEPAPEQNVPRAS